MKHFVQWAFQVINMTLVEDFTLPLYEISWLSKLLPGVLIYQIVKHGAYGIYGR